MSNDSHTRVKVRKLYNDFELHLQIIWGEGGIKIWDFIFCPPHDTDIQILFVHDN
jgi:hypothetical protein